MHGVSVIGLLTGSGDTQVLMLLLLICLQTIAILILLVLAVRQRSSINESSFTNLRDSVFRLDGKTDRTEQALRSGIQELRTETSNGSQRIRDDNSAAFRDLQIGRAHV